jgi:hypothetical protein
MCPAETFLMRWPARNNCAEHCQTAIGGKTPNNVYVTIFIALFES